MSGTLPDIELYETAYRLPKSSGFTLTLGHQLENALFVASNSYLKIPDSQARIHKILEEKKRKGIEVSEIEREAREYQLEYIEKHLTRASEAAQKRLDYFASIDTASKVQDELERCASDTKHWFEYYAWGYDPRPRSPLSVVPFVLFPAQERLVDWLDKIVFTYKTSGIIEKSRDEGATDVTTRWSVYHWRFTEGFSALFSSRIEDAVDSKKNLNTIFERLRFQIRLMPKWMLPKNFDIVRGLTADKFIYNPENLSSLLGSAPTQSVGRSDRVTCAFLDEFAFYPFAGYPQFTSLSQTTDSIIPLSSVAGKLNKYYELAHDGVTDKFTLDWKENPLKDKRWYMALPFGFISPKMSQMDIAQEVDRDYDASQPGKVFKLDENYLFISRAELLAAFKAFKLDHKFYAPDGKFMIPLDFSWSRFSDYGQTDGHEWGYVLAGVPNQTYPAIFQDTVFVFIATWLLPTGLTEREAVKLWREYERDLGLRNEYYKFTRAPKVSKISHEQKELRSVLSGEHAENWQSWETDYNAGITGLQNRFDIIDKHLQNPFRPVLMGRTRIVFVAWTESEYQFFFNEREGKWQVTYSNAPDGVLNFAQVRKELSAYHYPESERGKPVKAMRPAKELDNIVDPLRALGISHALKSEEGSQKDRLKAEMPAEIRELTEKKTLTMGEQLALSDAYREAEKRVRKKYDPRLNSLPGADPLPSAEKSLIDREPLDHVPDRAADPNGFESDFDF